jgi:hypothetical protein
MGLQGGIYDGWGQKSFLSDLCAPDAQRSSPAGVSKRCHSRGASRRLNTQVRTGCLDAHRALNDRDAGAETAVISQNFILSLSINSICWIGYEYRKLDSAILVMKAAKDRL